MKLTTPLSTQLPIVRPQGATLEGAALPARVLSTTAPTGPARVLSTTAHTGPARAQAPVRSIQGKFPRVRLLSKKVRRAAAASFGITFLALFQAAHAQIKLDGVKKIGGELSDGFLGLVPIIAAVVIAGAVVAYMMGNSQAKALALKAIVLSSIAGGIVALVK